MTTLPLHAQLRRFGRRLLALSIAAGVGWGLTAAVVAAVGAAWIDLVWELPPAVRIAGIGFALLSGIGVLIAAAARALQSKAPQALARRLDAVGDTGGQIRAGVDLMLVNESAPPLTAGLAAMAVDRAGQLAQRIASHKAVPTKPAGWSFASFAVGALVVASIALVAPRVAQTQWARFTDPFGDHPPYSRVTFNVEPGDARVIFGSGLDIRATTDGPAVDKLVLVLETAAGPETLPMFPEPDGAWRASVASVTEPGRYFVRAAAGRSQRFGLAVVTVPQIESVKFRITPPAYTNRPAYEGPLPPAGIEGLPGAQVQVWVRSNRPLAGGKLELPGMSLDLSPTAGSYEATASFNVSQAGKLSVRVTDVDGQPSPNAFTALISVLADERPFVRLLEPPALSFASPEAMLPVVVAAEDDYGISRVQLFRSLNDSRALPLELLLKQPPPLRYNERVMLPLATYGLQPGDEIKLFARVEDNDPAGAKGSESSVVVVRIISAAEFDKMERARHGMELLQSKYNQAQREMAELREQVDRLRKKMAEQPDEESAQKAGREALEEMAEALSKEADRLRKSAQNDLGYDIDKHLSRHLEKMANQVELLSRKAQAKAGGQKLSAAELAKALEEMQNELQREQQEAQEQTVDPLERLAQVQPLLEDAARFTELYKRQRDLANRLKSLDGKDKLDDPKLKARMRDLQTEQQRLRTDLSQLLDDIDDHLEKLPNIPELEDLRTSAREFVDGVRASGADEAMNEADAGLGAFSGTRGHAGAKKAADILEEFMGKCNGMGKGCKSCLRFAPGLGNTCEQLLAEAGLGEGDGQGMGSGSGDGYSARRNSMRNVGLYGGQPSQRSGDATGGNRASQNRTGSPTVNRSGTPGTPAPGMGAKAADAQAALEMLVPSSYRKRVAEYFQRIADETGGK